jgi:hypothetical protein
MKQTAVEWLCEQYHLKQDIEIVKQAKEMEKQQIIDAVYYTCSSMTHYDLPCGEQYYEVTFKK